jgi:hypothetical protein
MVVNIVSEQCFRRSSKDECVEELIALTGHKLILEDRPEIPDEEKMVTTRRSGYPRKHKELNEHNYKHSEISKEGQEDQVQFRRRDSIEHAGNVRMIENTTTRLPIHAGRYILCHTPSGARTPTGCGTW